MARRTRKPKNDAPEGPWGRTWLLALVLVVLALGGIEWFWRAQGQRAGVVSDADLWSYYRAQAVGAGPDTVAWLGGSRMQMGLIPEVFAEENPGVHGLQLAIAGLGPFAALRDLAQDASFKGVVVCSVNARALHPARWRDQLSFVRHYQTVWGPGREASLHLAVPLQRELVLLQPHLAARSVARTVLAGTLPGPAYVTTRFDRLRIADYSIVDLDEVIAGRLERVDEELAAYPPDDEAWARTVAAVRGFVARIQERGGKVALVAFPVRGPYRERLERAYPRARFWDRLAAESGAVAIRGDDLPGAASLRCPDGSHLDAESARRFTRMLSDELKGAGLLPE